MLFVRNTGRPAILEVAAYNSPYLPKFGMANWVDNRPGASKGGVLIGAATGESDGAGEKSG